MSVEQAKEFIERMKTDRASWAKIMAAADVAGRLRLANAEGYDFTEKDIKSMSAEFDEIDQLYVNGQYSRCECDDCDDWRRCG